MLPSMSTQWCMLAKKDYTNYRFKQRSIYLKWTARRAINTYVRLVSKYLILLNTADLEYEFMSTNNGFQQPPTPKNQSTWYNTKYLLCG